MFLCIDSDIDPTINDIEPHNTSLDQTKMNQTVINQKAMNQTTLNKTSMTSNKSMIAGDKKNDNDEEDFNLDKIDPDSRWNSDFNRVTGDLIKYSFKFVNMNSYLHENTKLIHFNYITENCIKLCI